MKDSNLLEGKKILIVDDEPDVLETLEDLLSMCVVVKFLIIFVLSRSFSDFLYFLLSNPF